MTLRRDAGVDVAAVERAVRELLTAVGAPVERDPELVGTPARVARMYVDELLDGYRVDPAVLLRDGVDAVEPGLVVLSGVRFAFVCPHHLLPAAGRAHIGYLPGGRVVGLGTLVKLLEAYAHRLILQEALGQRVAEALVTHLGARGAGVVIAARHQCLAERGERQRGARLVTTALAGEFATDVLAREMFVRSIPARDAG